MKQETFYCDLCQQQIDEDKIHKDHFVNILDIEADKYGTAKYTDYKLDLCDKCLDLCTPVIKFSKGSIKIRDYNKKGYNI